MEIGAIAAVIQFIDVGCRLSARLTKFCADFRDAPQQIQRLNSDLKKQLAIAQDIETTTRVVSSEVQSLATFEHPHQDYMSLAKAWSRGWRRQIVMEYYKEAGRN